VALGGEEIPFVEAIDRVVNIEQEVEVFAGDDG